MTLRLIRRRAKAIMRASAAELAGKPAAFKYNAREFAADAALSLSRALPEATLLWHWNGRGITYTVAGIPHDRIRDAKQALNGCKVQVITNEELDRMVGNEGVARRIAVLAGAHPANTRMDRYRAVHLSRMGHALEKMDDERVSGIYDSLVRQTPRVEMPREEPRPSNWRGLPSQRPK